MNETQKTNRLRSDGFFKKYFQGRVLDIGCGNDLVVPYAEPHDILYGHADAGRILNNENKESYDCVYSSHCLEHMGNVPAALEQWWGLVKPGGFMILVVPDEDLYEQGIWPSRFNNDHKATFRLHAGPSWSKVSYSIEALVRGLNHVEIISMELQDAGYRYFLKSHWIFKRPPYIVARAAVFIKRCLCRAGVRNLFMEMLLDRLAGLPVDQTLGDALAQIQVVVRKTTPNVFENNKV